MQPLFGVVHAGQCMLGGSWFQASLHLSLSIRVYDIVDSSTIIYKYLVYVLLNFDFSLIQ